MEFHVPMRLVYARTGGYSPEEAATAARTIEEASREVAKTMAKSVNETSSLHGYCFYLEVTGPPGSIDGSIMSDIYDKVKEIVDGYDRAGTSDPLHHALLNILEFCDSSDDFGDEIETEDIRSIVIKRIGES